MGRVSFDAAKNLFWVAVDVEAGHWYAGGLHEGRKGVNPR